MNLNINTPEFWERVKSDFENSNQTFLCYAIGNFNDVWQWYARRAEILEFAEQFLRDAKGFEQFKTGDTYLFSSRHEQTVTREQRRQIRLEFINYMITKTQHT